MHRFSFLLPSLLLPRFLLQSLLLFAGACACASASGSAAPRPSTAGPGVHVLTPALAMPGLDRLRTVRVYLPPGYAAGNRRYPVLYMHDGQNLFDDSTSYIGEWGVDESLDALSRSHGIELIVVGIDNGQDKRMNELSPWTNARFGKAEGEQYLDFIVNTVKPLIDRAYRTRPEAGSTGIMGSSMGGLMSHYAIHRHPRVFSRAGIFSPSYWYAGQVFEYTRSAKLRSGSRLYLLVGGKEGDDTTANVLKMQQQLQAERPRDLALSVTIRPLGEHNETFWKAEFPAAIIFLFGKN